MQSLFEFFQNVKEFTCENKLAVIGLLVAVTFIFIITRFLKHIVVVSDLATCGSLVLAFCAFDYVRYALNEYNNFLENQALEII
jgi:hypothetical protein